MKRRAAAKIPPAGNGKTLLGYLSGRFNYHTFEEWKNRIIAGELSLNGTTCSDPEQILQTSDLLEYHPSELIEPAVRQDFKIIFEDEFLLVIDKPGNLPVHPAGPYFAHTLWALLKNSGYENFHFVNRLDRETSGLLIAAKSSLIAAELNKTLPDMLKRYNVLVHGTFPQALTAEGFLVPDTTSVIRKKQRYINKDIVPETLPDKAVTASTEFELLQSSGNFSLLAATLKTGRMHQIRATLHGLGHPVVGDKLYGLDEQFYRRLALDTLSEADRKLLILERQALHCSQMAFIHPVHGKTLTFSSPIPEEFFSIL